jgi:hypothetical protein
MECHVTMRLVTSSVAQFLVLQSLGRTSRTPFRFVLILCSANGAIIPATSPT